MAHLITLVLAVLLGFFIVYAIKPKNKSYLKFLLAFSGSFLLSISVFNFLPEVYETGNKNIGIFIMLGIVLQIILEFFSKGAEHGHVHLDKTSRKFPWVLFISLSIHALLEGIPVEAHHNLIYGILVHKLPVAIILSTFFLASNLSKYKVIFFMILFALMTPIGWYLSNTTPFIKMYYTELSAVVIGIFLHISTTILFEINEGHKFNITKLLTIILAILLAYFL